MAASAARLPGVLLDVASARVVERPPH